MLYYSLGFFLIAVVTLVLGFMTDLAQGAAGFANLALLISLVLLAMTAMASDHPHQLQHRPVRR